MIKVVLPKNESVRIEIEGTDGWFEVSYGKARIEVRSDPVLHDDKGRKGTLYQHRYDLPVAPIAAAVQVSKDDEPVTADNAGDRPATLA